MATKKTLLTICAAGILCCGCSDYLEENPEGMLTEEQAFCNLTQLKNNALLSIYNYIGGNASSQGLQGTDRGVYDLNSLTTDEQIIPIRSGDWEDGYLWYRLFQHTWGSDEEPFINTWNYLFKVIVMTNEGIEQMENYKKGHAEESMKVNTYIAELRALRALFYFYAMDLWGRVPLITSTGIKTSDMTLSDRRTTFLFIVNELQEALPYLEPIQSPMPSSEYYGRITYPVAVFLLAKLALNAEVYYDNDWTDDKRPDGKDIYFTVNGEKKNAWQATESYCKQLDRFHTTTLLYSANFSVHNETSVENIFTIPMDPTIYSNQYVYFFRSRHFSQGNVLGGKSENGTCGTVTAIKAFGYGTDHVDYRFYDCFYADTVYQNGQMVYDEDGVTPLVYHPLAITQYDLSGLAYEKTAGARIKKYAPDPTARMDSKLINNDIVLFRYSDALLMRAEALVRMGNGELAYPSFSEVRNRGTYSFATIPSVITLDMIYKERLLELMWEGWRRNDMIRFGTYNTAYDLKDYAEHEADGHTIVFPIPTALLQMHPDWKQNPGY